jgi:hypothetical protein
MLRTLLPKIDGAANEYGARAAPFKVGHATGDRARVAGSNGGCSTAAAAAGAGEASESAELEAALGKAISHYSTFKCGPFEVRAVTFSRSAAALLLLAPCSAARSPSPAAPPTDESRLGASTCLPSGRQC